MPLGFSEEELFEHGHTACAGCGSAIAMRFALKAAGKNTIVSQATGCMEVTTTGYPRTAWKVPYIHCAFETAAAVASGIHRALKASGKRNSVNLLAIGGDGGTFDIGLQALSGAAERGEKFTYICNANEGYMNTGAQRSGDSPKYADTSTTPYGTKIHGKMQYKKNMPFIMAAHGINYVATANVAFLKDYVEKIKNALATDGVSYVEVFAPCVPGWKYSPENTIEIAKLAVQTRFTPLFEINKGILTITNDVPEPKQLKEFLQLQGRFKSMTDAEIEEVQKHLNDEWQKLKDIEKCKVRIS